MVKKIVLAIGVIIGLIAIQIYTPVPAMDYALDLLWLTVTTTPGHLFLIAGAVWFGYKWLAKSGEGFVSDRGKAISDANLEMKTAAEKKEKEAKEKAKKEEQYWHQADKDVRDKIIEIRESEGMFPRLLQFVAHMFSRSGDAPPAESKAGGTISEVVNAYVAFGLICFVIAVALGVITVKSNKRWNSTVPVRDTSTAHAVSFCTGDGTAAHVVLVSADETMVSPETLSTQCYVLSPEDRFENNANFRGVLYTKVHKADGTFVLLNNGYLFTEVP